MEFLNTEGNKAAFGEPSPPKTEIIKETNSYRLVVHPPKFKSGGHVVFPVTSEDLTTLTGLECSWNSFYKRMDVGCYRGFIQTQAAEVLVKRILHLT